MNFNWMFFPTLMLALGLFALGSKLASGVRMRPEYLAIWIIAVILALPSLLFIAYYRHLLDTAIWFYALRSAPGSELLASGVGFLLGGLNGVSQKKSESERIENFGCPLSRFPAHRTRNHDLSPLFEDGLHSDAERNAGSLERRNLHPKLLFHVRAGERRNSPKFLRNADD